MHFSFAFIFLQVKRGIFKYVYNLSCFWWWFSDLFVKALYILGKLPICLGLEFEMFLPASLSFFFLSNHGISYTEIFKNYFYSVKHIQSFKKRLLNFMS